MAKKSSVAVKLTYRISLVKHVGGGGVVEDDDLLNRSTQLGQVLHVIALMVNARLPKKAVAKNMPLVQKISHRISVLRKTCGEQYTLVDVSHGSEEFVHMWPLEYIYLMYYTVNFNSHLEIRLVYCLEGAVDKCFIKINYETLLASISFFLGTKEGLTLFP